MEPRIIQNHDINYILTHFRFGHIFNDASSCYRRTYVCVDMLPLYNIKQASFTGLFQSLTVFEVHVVYKSVFKRHIPHIPTLRVGCTVTNYIFTPLNLPLCEWVF